MTAMKDARRSDEGSVFGFVAVCCTEVVFSASRSELVAPAAVLVVAVVVRW